MLDSLRARLLLWYALILALIILTFATTVCYFFWRSLVQDVDRDLRSASTVILRALRPAASGDFDFDLPRQYRESEFVERSPRTYYAVFNPRGELIDRSDPGVPAVQPPALGVETRAGMREISVSGVDGVVVLVGRDLSEARQQVLALARTVAAVGSMALLLSLLGGWFLVSRALAPVSRISRAATTMSRGDLSARIPIEQTENELEQLASTLNDAFDRLRLAADVQRRFTADASHELRTPLATIAAEFDWALARPREAADYRQTIDTCRRASDRMRRIVDELLVLARNDSGVLQPRHEPVELTTLIHDAISLLQPLADERHIVIETALEAAWIPGDRDEIGELITNLLKNALEYNREAGRVSIEVRMDERAAHLSISDTGIGIAPEHVPHVFERFYRADQARTRPAGGAGLGLAIAKRIVDEHQGAIACHSELRRGTRITVRFPSSAPVGLSGPRLERA